MNEFITWETLGTYGGASAMVIALTQCTKRAPMINKMPTQLWSYILAFFILICAMAFTSNLTIESATLTLFNAFIVSGTSNASHLFVKRIASNNVEESSDVDG